MKMEKLENQQESEKISPKSHDIIKIIEPTEEVFKAVDFYIELIHKIIPESKITLIGSLAIPTCTKNEMDLMIEIEPDKDINKILEQITNNGDERFYSGTVVNNEGFVRSKKKYGIRCELHILHKDDVRVGKYLEQVKRFKSDAELTKKYETLKRSMNGKTEAEYKEAKNIFFRENNF
ncbi:MAG: GrpB family protein [Patescibacteria group bacterium]